jgi:hypothetical protein
MAVSTLQPLILLAQPADFFLGRLALATISSSNVGALHHELQSGRDKKNPRIS